MPLNHARRSWYSLPSENTLQRYSNFAIGKGKKAMEKKKIALWNVEYDVMKG